mmetsp:Transcript_45752/g.73577  ORF Transcript_45752/g.73577 Transcript_45752/m.73577 type:complete len:459 (+) Transcript_45752:132-1508(+)
MMNSLESLKGLWSCFSLPPGSEIQAQYERGSVPGQPMPFDIKDTLLEPAAYEVLVREKEKQQPKDPKQIHDVKREVIPMGKLQIKREEQTTSLTRTAKKSTFREKRGRDGAVILAEDAETQRRKRRKRELARKNRQKAKDRMDFLFSEVERLKTDIHKSKSKLQRVQNCGCQYIHRMDNHRRANCSTHFQSQPKPQPPPAHQLNPAVNSAGSSCSNPIEQLIGKMHAYESSQLCSLAHAVNSNPEEFAKSFVLTSTRRRSRAAKHKEQLREVASRACPPLRFLAWALDQDKEFYCSSSSSSRAKGGSSSIWRSFINHTLIGITKKQVAGLFELKPFCKAYDNLQREIEAGGSSPSPNFPTFATVNMKLVEEDPNSNRRVIKKEKSLHDLEKHCLQRLRKILKPSQFLSLCVWAHQNKLFIDSTTTNGRRKEAGPPSVNSKRREIEKGVLRQGGHPLRN